MLSEKALRYGKYELVNEEEDTEKIDINDELTPLTSHTPVHSHKLHWIDIGFI